MRGRSRRQVARPGRIETEHPHGTARRLPQTDAAFERRRLARTVAPEQSEDRAPRHREAERIDGGELSEALYEPFDDDRVIGAHRISICASLLQRAVVRPCAAGGVGRVLGGMILRSTAAFSAIVSLAVGSATRATAQPVPPPPAPPPLATPGSPAATPATSSPAASPSAPAPSSATPLPSGVPSPGPSPAQPGNPIRLDRRRLAVVPGGTVTATVSGGAGPIGVRSSFDGATARYDDATRTLLVSGQANGRGTVTLFDAAGDTATVDVLVAPPAGVVPSDASVEFAGNVGATFAKARVQAAIAKASQLQPGVTAAVGGITIAPLRPGQTVDLQAPVRLNGNDTFVDQTGTTNVHLKVDALPPLDPAVLFYSDDPERLGALDDGVLFRGTIDASRPARVYAYHVSDSPGRRLFLVLQASGPNGSSVQILGALAGPSDAFSYVGHLATSRYLLERASQESFIAAIAPGIPFVLPMPDAMMLPGQLTAAIQDLRVLSGDAVAVAVVGASNGTDPASFLAQPEHPGDGHERRGEFALGAVPPLALAFTAGNPEPPPFAVGVRYYQDGPLRGQPVFPNLRPGGTPLAGDYGVLRTLRLQLSNPSPLPQQVYFYEQPATGGLGGVTTTIWFDGDPAPTELRCVSDPARYLVKAFTLAAGEARTVTGSYMTDGTSWFPLLFGLTATAPAPVPQNGCGAKPAALPPAAAPSPEPSPSGG